MSSLSEVLSSEAYLLFYCQDPITYGDEVNLAYCVSNAAHNGKKQHSISVLFYNKLAHNTNNFNIQV